MPGQGEARVDEAILRGEGPGDVLVGTGEVVAADYGLPNAEKGAFEEVEGGPMETLDLGIEIPEVSPDALAKQERKQKDEDMLAQLMTKEMTAMLDGNEAEVTKVRNMIALHQSRMNQSQ